MSGHDETRWSEVFEVTCTPSYKNFYRLKTAQEQELIRIINCLHVSCKQWSLLSSIGSYFAASFQLFLAVCQISSCRGFKDHFNKTGVYKSIHFLHMSWTQPSVSERKIINWIFQVMGRIAKRILTGYFDVIYMPSALCSWDNGPCSSYLIWCNPFSKQTRSPWTPDRMDFKYNKLVIQFGLSTSCQPFAEMKHGLCG